MTLRKLELELNDIELAWLENVFQTTFLPDLKNTLSGEAKKVVEKKILEQIRLTWLQ